MASAAITTGQKNAPPAIDSMSFLEHLEELRRRVVYAFLYVVAGLCVCWGFHEKIFAILQRPIAVALANHHLEQKLVYLNPTDPFDRYLKISFLAGVFVASPFVLYQLWTFIAPALYRNERRYVLPFMVSTVGLFLAGGFFGYKLVYPSALDFLIAFSGQFTPMITIGEYTSLFLNIIGGLGVVSRYADPGVLSGAYGHRERRLDVAQLPLRNSGDLRHRRHYHTDDGHYEHVHLCGTYDWPISGEHRNCMVRTSDAEK
jgi:Tat protein translocase TatC